jgi:hypothetical protein
MVMSWLRTRFGGGRVVDKSGGFPEFTTQARICEGSLRGGILSLGSVSYLNFIELVYQVVGFFF